MSYMQIGRLIRGGHFCLVAVLMAVDFFSVWAALSCTQMPAFFAVVRWGSRPIDGAYS